jgi:hypothetical protein
VADIDHARAAGFIEMGEGHERQLAQIRADNQQQKIILILFLILFLIIVLDEGGRLRGSG